MITGLLFLLAAAGGAVARGVLAPTMWRTAAVNVAGSFLLGLASGWTSPTLTIVGAGALGSFTTFSSFVAQWSESVAEPDRQGQAIAYLAISVFGGLVAALLGIELAG